VADAISRGCKFDFLAMAWLPEHCRDEELTAEFGAAGDGTGGLWLYYKDTNHTAILDAELPPAMGKDSSAN
jgi:hypothetical protein